MQHDRPASYGRPYPRHVARRQALLTTLHTLVYRLSGGRLGTTLLGMPMLLLTTWGRHTGRLRTAPLLYLPVDGVFVLVASNGGARQHPTWWFNLRARPEVLVQVGPVRGRAQARAATGDERRRYWPLLLQVYPPYSRYQARTDREIPLVILQPIDAQLYRHLPARYHRAPIDQRSWPRPGSRTTKGGKGCA
jgi:deazaflavin-dependent oxidoreductase (nitroreductase family)